MANLEDVIVTGVTDDPRSKEELESYDWGSVKISRKEGLRQGIKEVSESYTTKTNDSVILVTNTSEITITVSELHDIGSKLTVVAEGTELVNIEALGLSNIVITPSGESITMVCDGVFWHVLSRSKRGGIVTLTETQEILHSDDTVLADTTGGAFDLYLQDAPAQERHTIKLIGTNSVTISPDSGTIDGLLLYSLSTKYDFIEVISDGTNWHIISKYEA